MVGSRTTELSTVLSVLLGRRVKAKEIIRALEMAPSTYYLQREEGRLITADNLLKLADELEVNPVGLLARYGFFSSGSVLEYAAELGADGASPVGTRRLLSPGEPLQARRDAPPL